MQNPKLRNSEIFYSQAKLGEVLPAGRQGYRNFAF